MFIISAVTPMTIGINVETSNVDVELEEMLDDLRFMCTTPYGFNDVKYEYYKEQLLSQYSSEGSNDYMMVETKKDDLVVPMGPLSNPVISGGPMDSAWPVKCFNTHHTSRSPYSTADNSYEEKWRFYSDNWVENTPVIDSDGTIYIGEGWDIHAVNPDGTEKWMFETGGLIMGSSPAIAEDGTIYVGSWDDRLYAINPDGTLKWRSLLTGGNIGSSPVIADDGTIYFGNSHNNLVAVNPSNGTIKWIYGAGNGTYSDPCIGDDGTIYIGSDNPSLHAVYPKGTLRWVFSTGGAIKGPPSIADDGTIYAGSYDTYLYAINPDGAEKWKCGIGYGIATNPSIASDGTIYVGGDKVYAVYPNGTMRWTNDMGGNRHIDSSSPAISADGTIYVGTNIGNMEGGEIIAINPDGTEKWRKRIANDWVESSPSIAEDGTVYIGCAYDYTKGYLHAFGNVDSNSPPSIPSISGPTQGKPRTYYWYTFVADDPDNNPIELFVDWGDDSSGWVDWFASGETMWVEKSWDSQGTYTIRAKVRDDFGGESDWGELSVTMPRNRAINRPFFNFLESHPNMFPILRQLLGL